jgi:iron complex transport system permease protein
MFPGNTPSLLSRQPITTRSLIICSVLMLVRLSVRIASLAHGPAEIPYSSVAKLILRGLHLPVGPDYRVLAPASALAGAIFLIVVDTAARRIVQPVEVQAGSLTALLGVPFSTLMLWRQRFRR